MRNNALKARLVPHVPSEHPKVALLGRISASTRINLTTIWPRSTFTVDVLVVTAGVQVGEDVEGKLFYNISHSEAKGCNARENGEEKKKAALWTRYGISHIPP